MTDRTPPKRPLRSRPQSLIPWPLIFGRLIPWLLAYLVLLAVVIGGVFYSRNQALAVYGTGQAQAQWDEWRADAKRMAQDPTSVERRIPKSPAPPALVLMRDHFAACLGLAVVLSTILFGTFALLLRGALQPPAPSP